MSPISRAAVSIRRLLARRRWIYWLLVSGLASACAAQVLARLDEVEAERVRWGETRTVLVAARDIVPGEPLSGVTVDRHLPIAMIPESAVTDVANRIARQHVAVGEMITTADITAGDGPQALVPEGWLAVAIVESPSSGAAIGDRVQVASDGVVISSDALVVGFVDDVTLVAAPAHEAPLLPAAAAASALALLLVP